MQCLHSLCTHRPWRFLRVDQRCHGSSLGLKHLPQPSTVAASAADVGRFLDSKLGGRPLDALIGHSLGGKVVLDLLTQRRDSPPTKQVLFLSLTAFLYCWCETSVAIELCISQLQDTLLPAFSGLIAKRDEMLAGLGAGLGGGSCKGG